MGAQPSPAARRAMLAVGLAWAIGMSAVGTAAAQAPDQARAPAQSSGPASAAASPPASNAEPPPPGSASDAEPDDAQHLSTPFDWYAHWRARWLAAQRRARAHPLPPLAPSPRWYGWQTLIADGISGAAVLTAVALPNGYLGAYGFVSFLLAGPIIHGAHRRLGAFLGSFAIRAVATLIALYALSTRCFDGCRPSSGLFFDLAFPIALTAGLDALWLGWSTPEPDGPR